MRGARALLAGKHEQLGMGDQEFGGGFLKLAACLDPPANAINPFGGNGLHAFLAADHEREGPERMAFAVGAMTGRLTAATVRKRKRSRQSILGDSEAGY